MQRAALARGVLARCKWTIQHHVNTLNTRTWSPDRTARQNGRSLAGKELPRGFTARKHCRTTSYKLRLRFNTSNSHRLPPAALHGYGASISASGRLDSLTHTQKSSVARAPAAQRPLED